MADNVTTIREASLLGIPYTVREDIYIDVLDWAAVELFLHANQYSPPPFAWSLPNRNKRPNYHTSMYLGDVSGSRMWKINSTPDIKSPQNSFANSHRLPTLSGLLASCWQIRVELGELFWRRTRFTLIFQYDTDFDQPLDGLHTRVSNRLMRRFADGVIRRSIQKLTLVVDISPLSKSWKKRYRKKSVKCTFQGITSEINKMLKVVLTGLPNLQDFTLAMYRPVPYQSSLMLNYGVFDTLLSSLAQVKHLRSVCICEGDTQLGKVLKKWKRHLPAHVNVDGSAKVLSDLDLSCYGSRNAILYRQLAPEPDYFFGIEEIF